MGCGSVINHEGKTMSKILTHETVAAAHKPYAFCNQCGAATKMAFSNNFFMKSGFPTVRTLLDNTCVSMPLRS